MWSANDVLGRLIPSCFCGAEYDLRFCTPHILPCGHTFCLMCLSSDKQRRRRRCSLCQKKYSTFILNAALAEIVERMRLRRDWLEEKSGKCDECDSRRPVTAMRRCLTCIRCINKHTSIGFTIDCVICLECCVGRHNGHNFIMLSPTASYTSATAASQPVALSTRLHSKRYLPSTVISSEMKILKQGKISDCELCTVQERCYKSRDSNVKISTCAIEEELVCETRSPLYYQVSSSISENVPNKKSTLTRLSDLIRSACGSRNSVAQKGEAVHRQNLHKWQNLSSATTNTDSTIYDRISPYRRTKGRASSSFFFDNNESLHNDSHYVNIYRRHSD